MQYHPDKVLSLKCCFKPTFCMRLGKEKFMGKSKKAKLHRKMWLAPISPQQSFNKDSRRVQRETPKLRVFGVDLKSGRGWTFTSIASGCSCVRRCPGQGLCLDEDTSWRELTSEAGGWQHSKQLSLSYVDCPSDTAQCPQHATTPCPTWINMLLNVHR